jgi:pimeloyl-ACP methyl ester carboxylesterase
VLTGDQDRMIPKEHSELLAERLPDTDHVVVPDAGHLVLLEKPEQVDEALTRLLRRVAAAVDVGSGA